MFIQLRIFLLLAKPCTCGILLQLQTSSFSNNPTLRQCVDFPFLTDDEVATWIVKGRFMFLMRGAPGSGKSLMARCFKTRFSTTKISSADKVWYLESNGEVYQCEVNRLSKDHEWCNQRARAFAEFGVCQLFTDNTNIRAWERRMFTEVARFHYIVIMVTPQIPRRLDTEGLAEHKCILLVLRRSSPTCAILNM
ncbi:2prime 3prime cyclic nucleotide [Fasciolopsis buskii]|uniref:2prime 3prime cyclic nucleotide n=1 Tax=Fasciolopsis buskii TaxID=27845 RepID=A0A8E0RUT7_9TREM|nr:2prime 3prime cyclic nucleotide [Fasciolopsis buski]